MATTKDRRAVSVLMGSAATFLASSVLGLASPAVAQDDEAAMEQMIVTGSRIPRADLIANSPISVVQAEEIALAGNVTIERVLNQLPQFVPGASSQSNNPGAGFATVDLRGLGNQRTLVLVNGRRWIPADPSAGFGGVDINTIPGPLVERVEVVTGGASAVYGSDAMAGVVNFILKEDFEGLEVGSQFDITHKGDAETYDVYALMGTNFDEGRGNITGFFEYYKQTAVQARDRDFTFFDCDDGAGDLAGRDGFTCGPPGGDGLDVLRRGGSSRILEGRISGGGFTLPDASTPSSILFLPNGDVRARSGVTDVFNFAPFTNIQIPLERWAISVGGDYELTEGVRFFAEGTYVNSRSDFRLAPTPLAEGFEISIDTNPFLTEAAKDVIRTSDNFDPATGNYTGSLFRRLSEFGDRIENFNTDAFRVNVGFEGELDNGWTWDASYLIGRTNLTDTQSGNIILSRAQQALLLEDDGSGNIVCQDPSGGCVPANFFGEGNLTEEMVTFLIGNNIAVGATQTQVAQFNIAGEVFELPAGPLQVAVGGEYRDESSSFTPDPIAAAGDIDGFNAAGLPLDGSFDVWEAYAETRIPVISDLPFARLVSLEAGVRWSDYSTVGTVWTFKGGGEWQVDESIRFRGLFQRAVRAPNVFELFGPQVNAFPGVDDFCDQSQDPVANGLVDLCVAQGVPASNFDAAALAIDPRGTFEQEDNQIESITGGNPNLEEERTNTWTVGVVFTPEFVPGLTVTADWYNITLDNAISQFGGSVQGVFDLCAQSNDINSDFCQAIPRRSDGNAQGVISLNENVSFFETSGLDLQVSYLFDLEALGLGDAGSINFNGNFTWVREWLLTPTDISEPVECAGKFGGDCGQTFSGFPTPDLRSVVRTTWSKGPYQLSVRWRWTGGLEDTNTQAAIPEVSGQHYFDLTGTYDIDERFQIRLGVENLTNNTPPRVGNSQTDANTLVPLFDVLGTRFFAAFTAKL